MNHRFITQNDELINHVMNFSFSAKNDVFIMVHKKNKSSSLVINIHYWDFVHKKSSSLVEKHGDEQQRKWWWTFFCCTKTKIKMNAIPCLKFDHFLMKLMKVHQLMKLDEQVMKLMKVHQSSSNFWWWTIGSSPKMMNWWTWWTDWWWIKLLFISDE